MVDGPPIFQIFGVRLRDGHAIRRGGLTNIHISSTTIEPAYRIEGIAGLQVGLIQLGENVSCIDFASWRGSCADENQGFRKKL